MTVGGTLAVTGLFVDPSGTIYVGSYRADLLVQTDGGTITTFE